jgi:hypothetical protein
MRIRKIRQVIKRAACTTVVVLAVQMAAFSALWWCFPAIVTQLKSVSAVGDTRFLISGFTPSKFTIAYCVWDNTELDFPMPREFMVHEARSLLHDWQSEPWRTAEVPVLGHLPECTTDRADSSLAAEVHRIVEESFSHRMEDPNPAWKTHLFRIKRNQLCLILALPLTLILAWYTRKWRRQLYRARTDRCLNCGYALTGNTSGRCPECGTPIRTPDASRGPDRAAVNESSHA